VTSNQGLLRAADSGTILLDEISEMPMNLQSKLLRVIQERRVMPIGK
jgi:two-component system response regulator FlrC